MPSAAPWLPSGHRPPHNRAHLLADRQETPHRPRKPGPVWIRCAVPAMLPPYTPRRNRRAARLSRFHISHTGPRLPLFRLRYNSPYDSRCQIEAQTQTKQPRPAPMPCLLLCKNVVKNILKVRLTYDENIVRRSLEPLMMPKDTNAPRETKSQNRFECRTMYIVRHCCATFRFLHLAQNTQWPPQGR